MQTYSCTIVVLTGDIVLYGNITVADGRSVVITSDAPTPGDMGSIASGTDLNII